MLLTDQIEIHQSQSPAWPSDLLYAMLAGSDWWISIRPVDDTEDWRKFSKRLHCKTFRTNFLPCNLVPRAHVSFGQRQDTELWKSSGIIHFKSPRFWDFRFHGACVPWFKTWCLVIKSMWMRIECLCGTNPRTSILPLDAFLKPKHACSVIPEVPKSWTLEMDYSGQSFNSRAPCLGADQRTRGLWERDCLPWTPPWENSNDMRKTSQCSSGL